MTNTSITFKELWSGMTKLEKQMLYVAAVKHYPLSMETMRNAGKGRRNPVLTNKMAIADALYDVYKIKYNIKDLFPYA